MRVNVDVLQRQLRTLSHCSNRLLLSEQGARDVAINKLASNSQLQHICLLVMRTLVGPAAAKQEDMVVFVHVYLHTTLMMRHSKAKNLASLLVVNNPGLLLAMTAFGNMLEGTKRKCFSRSPINSMAMRRAWQTCVVLFRASAKKFQVKLFANILGNKIGADMGAGSWRKCLQALVYGEEAHESAACRPARQYGSGQRRPICGKKADARLGVRMQGDG
jgi:hypothetical protein